MLVTGFMGCCRDGFGIDYSLEVDASSPYDAAHLFLTHVESHPGCGSPPTRETLFEVSKDGKVHRVHGKKLSEWILARREECKGPRGKVVGKSSA